MKTVMLIGRNGLIGWELERTLAPLGTVISFDKTSLNLNDISKLRETIRKYKPNLIVNAAAYTAVDKAENDRELALAVNGIAPGIIAEEAKKIEAPFIHYSTDYVFDGTKSGSYYEDDQTNPINYYGETKLIGEQAVTSLGQHYLILRTSWIYGIRNNNFLKTMLKLGSEKDLIPVVNDQVGAPTWCRFVAEVTAQIIISQNTSFHGIYHLSCAGQASWYQFAKAIFDKAGLHTKLVPITTEEYPTPAKRPKNSVLDNSKLKRDFGIVLPHWEQALNLCLDNKQTS